MADGFVLETGRGPYLLKLAGAPELSAERLVLPVVLEHRGGLERFGLICRMARSSPCIIKDNSFEEMGADKPRDERELLRRLAARFGPHFEQLREAALKSIRSQQKLLEIDLDLDELVK
jgi:hypothetical protein